MFKFNDKLVLKVDGEYMPVTCARNQISQKSKSLRVSFCTGESFWAKLSDLITLEEYAAIKASAPAPAPAPAPINLANPQEFADALAKLNDAVAIQELCFLLCVWLFVKGREYSPKSRSNKLAPYSKLVKELPATEGTTGFYQIKPDGSQWLRHLYYKYTGIADTNWAEINQKASQKVVESLADQKPIDADLYEQCVGKLLASEQVWEIGAGLIAASGRRPIEIVISGEFEEVDGEGLKFGGQAKKRDEVFEDYYIPLIRCSPKLFVEKLEKFRESCQIKNHLARVEAGEFAEGKEADNIRIQINRLGIAPILAWIPVEKNVPTCSDLRAAWVTIVESKYKNDSKYSLLYRSEILGHKLSVGNIPALNYSRYAVKSKSDFVADLREVEAVVEKWEKEEVVAEQVPVFEIGDRVLWCDLPAIVADLREPENGVGYDYFLKNDGGKHWSGWSQGLNRLVARVDELPASQKSAIENQQQITAISLHQPWASLIASGHKCFETRSWPTKYRGPIAIHAAKKIEEDPRLLKLLGIPASKVPRGAIVAIADLADCVQMDAAFIAAQSDTERMCGDWSVGRWAWRLENVRTIEPVAARGMQGLWQWEMPPFLEVVDHKFVPVVATAIKLVKIDSSPAITADISGRHEEVRAKLEKECPIENVDATAPSKNIDAIIPQIASRHEFDFYETPPWLTLLTLANVPLSGTIGECCVGHGAIASILQMANFKIWTNDIDPAKPADHHSDARLPESWQQLPPANWIVTNPPYADMSAPIVKNAYSHAKKGIVMILRQNWIEGCDDRRDFLKAHPPTLAISVPRYCYRKGKNGTWATDQCPTWIYIWDKSNRSGLTKIITLGADEIPLFHRTPEGIPSVEKIEAQVQRIMESKPVEEGDRITQTMLQFMEQNVGNRRVYVGQTVVAKLCKIGNNKANTWIKENRELLAKHNKGLNPFVTR
jgi:hypothetical protein